MPTIRVYPNNGMMGGAYGANGGMYGGAVSAQTYYTSKLNTQQQVSNMRLGYERALFNEKLDKVRLEERLKNPYMQNAGMMNPMLGVYGLQMAQMAQQTALLTNPLIQSQLATSNFWGGLGRIL